MAPAIGMGVGVSYRRSGGGGASGDWWDHPRYDNFSRGYNSRARTGFVATGPKVDGKYPKTAATFSDIFAFTAPAGRGYLPNGVIPYLYDTSENEPRFNGTRLVYEPAARFNRTSPSAVFDAPNNIYLINYPYLVSFYGTGSVTITGAEVPGGEWSLSGTGASDRVYGFLPHPVAGDVVVSPEGMVLEINMDTHGVSGLDPDYPTPVISTISGRVDQAAEVALFSADLMTLLSGYEGTIVVQGQFFAPARDDTGGHGRRVAIGWDHDAYLGVDVDGNAVNNTGWGVALSTPLGSGGNGDTFRLAFSWRNQSGGASDGIRRMAGNGGTAVQHGHPWNGGPGDHSMFRLGRVPNQFQAQDAGAGFYDEFLFNDELLSLEEVEAASAIT